MHIKEPPIDVSDEAGIRLYANFIGGGNKLPGIGSYRYGALHTHEATRIRFAMTMKSKDAICEESKAIFNKIETYGHENAVFSVRCWRISAIGALF